MYVAESHCLFPANLGVDVSETGDLLESVAKRELEWVSRFGRARLPFERLYRELYSYQKVHPDSHY